jgi:urea transport system substrate-binding protein
MDADDSAIDRTLEMLQPLLEDRDVSAIVGMHVSSVRQKLNAMLCGRVPYVYTPLYEGGEQTPGCFAIGETPAEQLAPAIRRLTDMFGARRWALVGNDYVWPRVSHSLAREYIGLHGGRVVFEEYVPFGTEEPYELVERMAAQRPEAILLSLVGQDAVEFNRVFGAMDLDRSMIRLSTAIEENVLLATGEKGTKRLFGASSYFAALRTQANMSFVERYHGLHGGRGPVLNALGQSIYEGMHFLAAMSETAGDRMAPLRYRSARGGVFLSNQHKQLPIYLARADGHQFSVLERLT